jgi:selenophosphate synthase
MKQTKVILAAVAILVFTSCHFSKGVKKDLSTGLSTSYNGFAVEEVYLSVDGNKLSNNKITLGKEIHLVADGVDYYEEKEGKVFPGCSIILTDKTGKEILNLQDAFAELSNGVDADKAKALTATINTGSPMVVGETYHLKTRFFDKKNTSNEIISNVDVVME